MYHNNGSDHAALGSRLPQRHRYSCIYLFLPTRSAVAIQDEDGGPWTQRTIIRHESEDHNEDDTKLE